MVTMVMFVDKASDVVMLLFTV